MENKIEITLFQLRHSVFNKIEPKLGRSEANSTAYIRLTLYLDNAIRIPLMSAIGRA